MTRVNTSMICLTDVDSISVMIIVSFECVWTHCKKVWNDKHERCQTEIIQKRVKSLTTRWFRLNQSILGCGVTTLYISAFKGRFVWALL